MHRYGFEEPDELDYPQDRAIEAVECLLHKHPTLVPYRDSLLNIAIASNIPDTGSIIVFQHISSIAARVAWLPDALSPNVDPNLFPLLAIIDWNKLMTRYQREKFFNQKSIRLENKPWRASSDFTPICRAVGHFEPLKPSEDELRDLRTLNQLRALILFAACRWQLSQNATALLRLSRTIYALMGQIPSDLSKRTPHPLLPDLSQIGDSVTRVDLANALTACLSKLTEVNQEFAKDVSGLYIPLLLDTAIIEESSKSKPIESVEVKIIPIPAVLLPAEEIPKPDTGNPSKPPRKKSKRKPRAKTSEKTTIRIPAGITPLPGESCEEASFALNASRRTEPSNKPIPLRDELRWANQRIRSQNTLLIRDHIDSLSDAEAFLFGDALIKTISSDIQSNNQTSAITGIFVGLTFALGRVTKQLFKLKIIAGSIVAGHDSNILKISVTDGVLQIPILRPESAFKATPEMQALLEPTLAYLNVALPPSLATVIRRASECGFAFDLLGDADFFEKSLQDYVRLMESAVGTGISLGRIRRTAPLRIREISGDISATMILTGDTFGSSTAPLYYGCLNSHCLQQHFIDSIWPLFSDDPTSQISIGKPTKVGSQLLVKPEVSRALARSLGSGVHKPGKVDTEIHTVIDDHNSLLNHVIGMELSAGTHRATNAIFQMSRFDFDTKTHGAILSDKKCDLAHLHRFTPTASLLSKQIENLLEHYRALIRLPGISLPAETKDSINDALLGNGPLFFHLDHELRPVHHVFATWVLTLPAAWSDLPLNWGRTWFASRGREAGISADCLAIALGHLEATGYPFSKQSPTEPMTLSRVMFRKLDEMAKNAGWICRSGLKSTTTKAERLNELGPLRDWQDESMALDRQVREFETEQRSVSRALIKSKKDAGEALVFEILKSELGAIAEELLTIPNIAKQSRKSGKALVRPKECRLTLEPEVLEKIEMQIQSDSRDDRVLQIASHNALHRYMKGAYKILGWTCPIPAPWLAASTMEPTPFFPGMMRARTQTQAMREIFRGIAPGPPAGSEFSALEWSFGICSIALALFGFVDRVDVLIKILDARGRITRSKKFSDLILVQWRDEPRRVAGFRGVAAVSICRLAKKFKNDPLPTLERLDSIIASQLPAQLVGPTQIGLLKRLCATISINNRIELSGIARTALDPDRGSVAMLPDRQRQFLEGGAGLVDGNVVTDIIEVAPDQVVALSKKSRRQPKALKQYKQLLGILNVGQGPKLFELTKIILSPANITAFRNPMKEELNAFLALKDLAPVVSCIAAFALHLTSNGTPQEKTPAPSTVYEYVTSFGRPLVKLTDMLPFQELEEEDYLDIYQDALYGLRGTRLWVATREIVNFHRYLQTFHGFVDADLSEIDESRGERPVMVDAEIIQPREFTEAKEILASMTAFDPPTLQGGNTDICRLRRQTRIIALLLRASGGRINEIAGLRFKDILARPECTVLLIKASRYRKLKTGAARRLVNLTERLSPTERQDIADWIVVEKSRLLKSWKSTAPVFGILGDIKSREKTEYLRDELLAVLVKTVGYRTRAHRLRHLVAGEQLLSFAFCGRDLELWQNFEIELSPRLILPRDLRSFTVGFGHRLPSTTIENYFHMAWAWTSRAQEVLDDSPDLHAGAVAMGISVDGVYKILRRLGVVPNQLIHGQQLVSHLLDHLLGSPSDTPGSPVLKTDNVVGIGTPLSARLIDSLLRDIQRGVSPNEALLAYGLTKLQGETLSQLAHVVEKKTGFSLWPRQSIATQRKRSRTARSFKSGKVLDFFLEAFDGDDELNRQLVISTATAYITWANRSKRDELCLPKADAERLTALLGKSGINPSRIKQDKAESIAGFVNIKVKRAHNEHQLLNHSVAWMLIVAWLATTETEAVKE